MHAGYAWLAVLAVVNSVASLFYYAYLIGPGYFQAASGPAPPGGCVCRGRDRRCGIRHRGDSGQPPSRCCQRLERRDPAVTSIQPEVFLVMNRLQESPFRRHTGRAVRGHCFLAWPTVRADRLDAARDGGVAETHVAGVAGSSLSGVV